jgi:hypothetical protein
MTFQTDAVREARLRRAVARQGYALQKSRLRRPIHLDDLADYRVIDPSSNGVVWGSRFELDLDDVEEWLTF